MNDPRIPQEPISSNANNAEEKSKLRADELKASSASSKRKRSSSNKTQEALEAAIVEELNLTFAIVHTSSTYVLIEKSESEFVLTPKPLCLTFLKTRSSLHSQILRGP